jgi:dCTP deaminase
VTPLEAQWYGKITIEISNTTPLPARIYANEGIIQLLFFRGARPDVTYGDRHGKYQNQRGIVLPRV